MLTRRAFFPALLAAALAPRLLKAGQPEAAEVRGLFPLSTEPQYYTMVTELPFGGKGLVTFVQHPNGFCEQLPIVRNSMSAQGFADISARLNASAMPANSLSGNQP